MDLKYRDNETLLAYTKGISKKEFVGEMLNHQKLDHFIKGTYSEGQKGCAVGCALKSIANLKNLEFESYNEHLEFENHLGIPEWLALVEDKIFEGLPLERSKSWPVEFSKAINEGADLNKVKAPFIIFILASTLKNFDHDKNPEVLKSINNVIALWKKYPNGPTARSASVWSAARYAAESAARSAAESARFAAESSAESSAESAAESAAWSAAESSAESAAESAAWSAARSAARSAAESAAWSAAESAAWSAARYAAYEKFADKLLELLKECK